MGSTTGRGRAGPPAHRSRPGPRGKGPRGGRRSRSEGVTVGDVCRFDGRPAKGRGRMGRSPGPRQGEPPPSTPSRTSVDRRRKSVGRLCLGQDPHGAHQRNPPPSKRSCRGGGGDWGGGKALTPTPRDRRRGSGRRVALNRHQTTACSWGRAPQALAHTRGPVLREVHEPTQTPCSQNTHWPTRPPPPQPRPITRRARLRRRGMTQR